MFKKRVGVKDCNCHTSLSPLYTTVTVLSDSAESARALITMRGVVMIDGQYGLQRLSHSATYGVSYETIAGILDEHSKIFYFERETDKALFLLVYPEYKGRV